MQPIALATDSKAMTPSTEILQEQSHTAAQPVNCTFCKRLVLDNALFDVY